MKLSSKTTDLASSAGIPPEESGGRKSLLEIFFSKPIRRLKPTERPAEEATTDQCLAVVTLFSDYALGQLVLEKWKKKINNTVNFEELNQLQNCYSVTVFGDILDSLRSTTSTSARTSGLSRGLELGRRLK